MKILLIRFSSIGDIVLTTPVARCLKKQLGATVHFLTKPQFSGILEPNPYIDRVIPLQVSSSTTLSILKAEEYDWVIDLHHNLRSGRFKWRLGFPHRSFNKLNLEKWLMVHTKINRLPDIHIVDRYLQTVAHLGIQNDGDGLDHFIPPAEEVDLSTLGAGLAANGYLAFVLGATHATKKMTSVQMLEILQGVTAPVVLLGGPAEAETGSQLAAAGGPRILNCCGKLSLHQSASVLRQAGLVLTHDTGLMHIAAALRKPIVSVWGNTIPAFGMYPYYPAGQDDNQTFEVSNLACRPCSKIGYPACPKQHFNCMNRQDVSGIIRYINQRLSAF